MGWSPRSLFAAGEQGVWYDPSDLSTMFEDSAGTTSAVLDGPVGKILDKSGRGNHATQATSTKRPILKQDANGKYYLLFDGVDDALATAGINFSATDKMSVFAGVRKLSDAAQACVAAVGLNGGTAGVNAELGLLLAPGAAAASTYWWRAGGSLIGSAANATGFASPNTAVLTAQSGISTDLQSIRINAATAVLGSGDLGTGNLGSGQIIYIGSRSGTSLPFNGHLYSLIVRGAQSTDAQVAAAEMYVNSKTGAY